MSGPILQPASPLGGGANGEAADPAGNTAQLDLGTDVGAGRDAAPGAGAAARPHVTRRLELRGTVQGVGLRPFVCRLGTELALDGVVRNAGDQVVIDATGESAALAAFLRRLSSEPPAPARVTDVRVVELDGEAPATGSGMRITPPAVRAVHPHDGGHDVFPPCPECVRELLTPGSRRYRYPFINCGSCGARAAVNGEGTPSGPQPTIPLPRAITRVPVPTMCADCRAEYADPDDRRFGIDPLACPACGPQLSWRAPDHGRMPATEGTGAVDVAVGTIAAGGVVAVWSPGGYQLVCDATRPRSVAGLRGRLGRWSPPFAVLVGDLDVARTLVRLRFAEEELLETAARPVVLAERRPGASIAAGVSPGIQRIGVFLPSSPLLYLLAYDLDRPLVVTSAESSWLPAMADGALVDDRPDPHHHGGSVAQVVRDRPVVLRRARGYASAPLRLPVHTRQPILAVGGQVAHTCALAYDDGVVMSNQHGDLSDAAAAAELEVAAHDVSARAGVQPQVVAHDLHPGYLSTQYASRQPVSRRIAVQHHHAHVASCAAEHGLTGPFIGVAYDEGGLGDDGTWWGGEVLVGDLRDYRRVGRFGAAPLPGGEAAVRRPAHAALGYLLASERLGGAPIDPELVATYVSRFGEHEVDTVRRMLAAGVNSPLTTSAARLFDAVVSILGLRDDVAYDGEAAMVLESAAHGRVESELPWRIVTVDGMRVYDPTPTLAAALAGVAAAAPVSSLAAGFHATLATVTAALCVDARGETGVGTVCLSGGSFSQQLLTAAVLDALRSEGFEVYVNEGVPTGDGGLSYGQAAVAAARLTSPHQGREGS